MNRTRVPTDIASEQKAAGQLMAGSGLQMSKSALTFDQTDAGDESFLTLKIASPRPNTLVVVSVKDPALFQIAIGVERLAYRQVLTFKPAPTGTYIHIRYTPEQAGRHQSVLIVEAPVTAETVSIPLLGHTGGLAAIGLPSVNRLPAGEPLVRRPNRGLLATLLIGGLVVGAGYVYRCQIWPGTCGPSIGLSTPADNQPMKQQAEPVRTAPAPLQPVAIEPKPEPTPERSETRSATAERTQPTEATARREKPRTEATEAEAPAARLKAADEAAVRTEAAVSETKKEVPTRKARERAASDEENADRKTTAKSKPAASERTQPTPTAAKSKPVTKPSSSEESELERILNKGGN